jgi:hypothetical protein
LKRLSFSIVCNKKGGKLVMTDNSIKSFEQVAFKPPANYKYQIVAPHSVVFLGNHNISGPAPFLTGAACSRSDPEVVIELVHQVPQQENAL